jgi:hypothetical protein
MLTLSRLHIGEGSCNGGTCQCSGFKVTNNQIGPAGTAPNTSWQFKRDLSGSDLQRRVESNAPGRW